MLFAATVTDPQTYFLSQGVLGVCLVVLAGVFAFYYRASQKKIDEKDKTIYDLQSARLQDSKDTTKEVTDVLQDNSQSLRVLSEKIEVGKAIERRR